MARPLLALSALALALAGCPSKEDTDCPSGQVRCGGICVDPASFQTDAGNCGSCGVACGDGTCSGGVCQCTGGTTLCDGLNPRCRDLQTDEGACGACTTSCVATFPGSVCQAGSCACGGANPDSCTTFCTDLQTDPENCAGAGGCGHPCPLVNDVCEAGTCTCPASLPDPCPTGTPTACVNLETDPTNCGSCGTICPLANDVCQGGSCACPAGAPTACGTTCVNTQTDEQHCGGCNAACATGATCTSGACLCPKGPTTGCGGTCCAGGTGCCAAGACQTKHANGLGQSYFDCNPLYAPAQTTQAAALAAADAWNPGTTYVGTVCDPYCVARQTASQCAVWCFGISNVAGRVGLNGISNVCSAACPGLSSPTWN